MGEVGFLTMQVQRSGRKRTPTALFGKFAGDRGTYVAASRSLRRKHVPTGQLSGLLIAPHAKVLHRLHSFPEHNSKLKISSLLSAYKSHLSVAQDSFQASRSLWSVTILKNGCNRNSHSLLKGMQNGTATLEDSFAFSYKSKNTLAIQSSNCAPW